MSINWTDRPQRGQGEGNFRLLRVPRSGKVQGLILATGLVGTGTHFWKGKTTPCGGAKCEACADGHRPRWYGYLPIWSPRSDQIGIAEISDGASDDVDRYKQKNGSLRGAELTLTRQGSRPNGRILSTVTNANFPVDRLPDSIDVITHLMRIWGLNDRHEVATQTANGQRIDSVDTLPMRAASGG